MVSSAIKIPLILGDGSGQLGDLDWLAARRVRVALQTYAPFSAAVQAVYDTLKALREGVPPRELKNKLPTRGTEGSNPSPSSSESASNRDPGDLAGSGLRAELGDRVGLQSAQPG